MINDKNYSEIIKDYEKLKKSILNIVDKTGSYCKKLRDKIQEVVEKDDYDKLIEEYPKPSINYLYNLCYGHKGFMLFEKLGLKSLYDIEIVFTELNWTINDFKILVIQDKNNWFVVDFYNTIQCYSDFVLKIPKSYVEDIKLLENKYNEFNTIITKKLKSLQSKKTNKIKEITSVRKSVGRKKVQFRKGFV